MKEGVIEIGGMKFPPDTFLYHGETYQVLGESNKAHMIPKEVAYDGKQFICNSRNGTLFDCFIFRENGKSYLLSIKKRGEKEKKEKGEKE